MSLAKLRYATREQLQRVHGLGTDRNALRVINELKEYTHKKRTDGRYVYYLSALGRDIVGVSEEIKWNQNVDHWLMRNDFYLFLDQPSDWRIEEPIKFKYQSGLTLKDMTIVPDATYTENEVYHFVEVDNTQSMVENRRKIEAYRWLFTEFKHQYKHTPILLFYTATDVRRETLRALCKEAGIECRVYTKEDIR